MNFIERIVYCYEYVFYTQYTCFNCGVDFRMKKMEDDEDLAPACSYGCLVGGVGGNERGREIQACKDKYGKDWKIKFTKYIKKQEPRDF